MLQFRTHRTNPASPAPERIADDVAAAERRTHVRHVTMLRVAVLYAAHGKELCVVKNISAGGPSARVYRTFTVGEPVEVELRSEERIEGSVQWVRDFEIGIAFPQEIDVESVLTSRWVTEDGRRQRLPRIELECRCRLRVGSRFYLATLADISQGGAKLQTHRAFQGSGEAILTLPDLGSLEGNVRWSHGNKVGLAFNERLPFELLVRWIQERRGSQCPEGAEPTSDCESAASGLRSLS
jgi:hypothetical protein